MRQFHVTFDEKRLTGNAGLVHLGRFADKLDLPRMLKENISIQRGPTARYCVADIIMMLAMGVLAGAKHMRHLAILRSDHVICALFKWTAFPDNSTLGRWFKLFRPVHCQGLSAVEDKARRKVWSKKWFGRITLDVDSTVRGVYGSQQGAEVGYNPKKKGQKSYHPLLCFIAETRECLHNWFRPSLLMQQSWRKAKNRPGVETTEFWHKCHGWKRARRFVAVRMEVETEGTLLPIPKYEFFCYVTNLSLSPWQTHKYYGKRASSENWIEWCKNQMASGTILTQDFWANSAIFQTCILAYNLLVWMMWLHSEKSLSEEPCTIRSWLIRVPARLIHPGRQWFLKLSKTYPFKEQWQSLESSIAQLNFA